MVKIILKIPNKDNPWLSDFVKLEERKMEQIIKKIKKK